LSSRQSLYQQSSGGSQTISLSYPAPQRQAIGHRLSWEELDRGSSWLFSWALRTCFFCLRTWGRKLTFPRYLAPNPYLGIAQRPAEKPGLKTAGEVVFFKKRLYAFPFSYSNAEITSSMIPSPSRVDGTTTTPVRFTALLNPHSATSK